MRTRRAGRLRRHHRAKSPRARSVPRRRQDMSEVPRLMEQDRGELFDWDPPQCEFGVEPDRARTEVEGRVDAGSGEPSKLERDCTQRARSIGNIRTRAAPREGTDKTEC